MPGVSLTERPFSSEADRQSLPSCGCCIFKALLAGQSPAATRKQENNLQAAILAALRKRDGGAVVGEGYPARWRLKG